MSVWLGSGMPSFSPDRPTSMSSAHSLVARLGVMLLGLLLAALTPSFLGSAIAQDDSTTCRYAPTRPLSQVRSPGLVEASALVASQQWPGIYWTLNDSNNFPAIYAFDDQGRPRGTFQIPNSMNIDWESMQLGPDGEGGYALFIGDLGDNNTIRRDTAIYRVPEPTPGPPDGSPLVGETAPAAVLKFTYWVSPRNVETMLVHPVTGEIVLISRDGGSFGMVYG